MNKETCINDLLDKKIRNDLNHWILSDELLEMIKYVSVLDQDKAQHNYNIINLNARLLKFDFSDVRLRVYEARTKKLLYGVHF